MTRTYSPKPSGLQPFTIPPDQMLSMGRIVRACAELEDILTLFLCGLADIGEGQATFLLGRTAISQKLEITAAFARSHGGDKEKRFKQCFESEVFKDIIRCRNLIAHGVLLGLSDEGMITFRTIATDGADSRGVRMEAVSHRLDHFENVAKIAELAVTELEAYLNVQPLREIRRQQSLERHSKAPPKRAPSARHPRQPKP